MQKRSSLSIQKDVIFAIFVREMTSRFSQYTFGNAWIILEPVLMITLFILLFGARGRGEFGYAEPAVFIFSAFLTFKLLWQQTMKKNMGALSGARSILGFRQVSLFDVFLARTVIEGGLCVVAGVVIALGLMWFGFSPAPTNPLPVFFYGLVLLIFASGFGILACIVASFAKEIEKLISLLTMPILFTSAVFFPMTVVPEPYRTWLAWNPLVHAMELIRENWLSSYTSPVSDVQYFLSWTIGVLALALMSYRLSWKRMVAS